MVVAAKAGHVLGHGVDKFFRPLSYLVSCLSERNVVAAIPGLLC